MFIGEEILNGVDVEEQKKEVILQSLRLFSNTYKNFKHSLIYIIYIYIFYNLINIFKI